MAQALVPGVSHLTVFSLLPRQLGHLVHRLVHSEPQRVSRTGSEGREHRGVHRPGHPASLRWMELKYQTYLNHISCIIMFIQDSLAADLRLKTTNGVREVRKIKPQIVKSKIFNSEQKNHIMNPSL